MNTTEQEYHNLLCAIFPDTVDGKASFDPRASRKFHAWVRDNNKPIPPGPGSAIQKAMLAHLKEYASLMG